MKISEVLVRALEIWGPHGEHWIRGALRNTNGKGEEGVCLYGAIGLAATGRVCYPAVYFSADPEEQKLNAKAYGDRLSFDPTYEAACVEIAKTLGCEAGRLAGQNDTHNFTFVRRKVCDTLKRVLDEEETQNAKVDSHPSVQK